MKVIFTQGLPASSKTTWAKNFCEKNPDWVRVNRDDLRNMRGRYWLPKDEKMITHWEISCISDALANNKNVIVDATNFNKKHIKDMKAVINNFHKNVEFETKFFDVSLEECIKRDLKRPNSVGEKVIRKMYNKYLKEDISIKQDKNLPKAWIFDLDGSLAIHNGRSPFEYEKCDTDLLNEPLGYILRKVMYDKGTTIIFLSGREEICKEKTVKWLREHKLYYNWKNIKLYMRKKGDYRKDYVVKKELFEENIKGKYYVNAVFDDRNQVVQLWRDLGLTCFQCAEGDF